MHRIKVSQFRQEENVCPNKHILGHTFVQMQFS